MKAYIENLELILYATNQLRANELGTLAIGSNVNAYGISIPPNEEAYNITSY